MSGEDPGSSDDVDPTGKSSRDGVSDDTTESTDVTDQVDPIDADPDGHTGRIAEGEHRSSSESGERPPDNVVSEQKTAPANYRANTVESSPRGVRGWWNRFWNADSGLLLVTREVLSSVFLVAVIGLLLFGISGVWPPMVAIQSGSMEPHMHKGDLVFVVDDDRFASDFAVEETGITPYQVAEREGHQKFGTYGDVIIFEADGSSIDDPIIHRAMFWVEEGEDWYDRANPDYVRAQNCEQLTNCPAPNSGFITKGDNEMTNRYYDQAQAMSKPVKPEWVTGKAMVRVPLLGYVRLMLATISVELVILGAFALGSSVQYRRLTV